MFFALLASAVFKALCNLKTNSWKYCHSVRVFEQILVLLCSAFDLSLVSKKRFFFINVDFFSHEFLSQAFRQEFNVPLKHPLKFFELQA